MTAEPGTLTQVEPATTISDSLAGFELTGRLEELYSVARTAKQRLQAQWRRNYLLTFNRQYYDASQSWSPNVLDSEIYPVLSNRIGWMTDQNITCELAPASAPGDQFYDHMQTLCDHLSMLVQSTSDTNNWSQEIVQMLWDAAQFGAGILKCYWDSGLDGGIGNVGLCRIDPWVFYPDPNATDTEDMIYCFEVRKMTFDEIERKFPGVSTALITEAVMFGDRGDDGARPGPNTSPSYPMAMPGALPPATASSYGLPGQSNPNYNAVTTQGVNVKECWIKENYTDSRESTDPTHPSPESVTITRWRVVIYSGHVVLLDELAEHLFEFDRHPYTRYVDEEMGEFWSVPLVTHMAPAAVAINRLLSAMQTNAELVGNPIFVDTSNSGLGRVGMINRPGLKVTMDAAAAQQGQKSPSWLEPPPMPEIMQNLVTYWQARISDISGITSVQKGQTPGGRQSAQTTQATQESASVRIRSSQRNLEASLSTLYQMICHLIVQNYTIPRTVAIVGPDGLQNGLRLAARHFYSPTKQGWTPLKFTLVVNAGSSNPTSRQARTAEADALFAMHAIDRQALLEAHKFPHWQQVNDRMTQQEQAQMAAMVAGQANAGVGTGHGRGSGAGTHGH
jgi:hypothetical protein